MEYAGMERGHITGHITRVRKTLGGHFRIRIQHGLSLGNPQKVDLVVNKAAMHHFFPDPDIKKLKKGGAISIHLHNIRADEQAHERAETNH